MKIQTHKAFQAEQAGPGPVTLETYRGYTLERHPSGLARITRDGEFLGYSHSPKRTIDEWMNAR